MTPKLLEPEDYEQWGPIDQRLVYPSFWFGPMSGAVKSKWGIYWANMFGILHKDQGTYYWERGSLENEGLKSIKRWLLPADKRKRVIDEYWPLLDEILAVVRKAERLGSRANFAVIRHLALKWYRLYYDFWSLTDVFEIANYGAPIYLKDKLGKIIQPQNMDEVLEALLAPDKLSFNQESEKALLECRIKAKSDADLKKLLAVYAANWFWLNNSYYGSVKLSPEYFYKKIRALSKTQAQKKWREINSYPRLIKNKKLTIIKKFRIPSSVVKTAKILSLSIWMQDHRKGFAWRMSETITMFSWHLAKQLGAPLEEVLQYSADEWKTAFSTGKRLAANIRTARQKPYVFYSKRGFYNFYTGAKAQKIIKHFAARHKSRDLSANMLTGTVVSKSPKPITGVVRVLHSARDTGKMKRGEILVTGMTSPDYIHAMRLAKAIITDVGGLMSHAAVVSRELGIPCIVNTKIATKILKTGDLVEVDTNNSKIKVVTI